jgi:hypothetical protein
MRIDNDTADSTESPQRITRSSKRRNLDNQDIASPSSPKRVATRSMQIHAADSHEELTPVRDDANDANETSNDANKVNEDDADVEC